MDNIPKKKTWIGRIHEYWGLVVNETDLHSTEDAAFRDACDLRREIISPLRHNIHWKFIKRSYVTAIQVEAGN